MGAGEWDESTHQTCPVVRIGRAKIILTYSFICMDAEGGEKVNITLYSVGNDWKSNEWSREAFFFQCKTKRTRRTNTLTVHVRFFLVFDEGVTTWFTRLSIMYELDLNTRSFCWMQATFPSTYGFNLSVNFEFAFQFVFRCVVVLGKGKSSDLVRNNQRIHLPVER